MYTDLALYIDGKWVNGGGRKGEDVINPATAKVVGTISMDALAVVLDVPVASGTTVTLLGDGILIEEHARVAGTIAYEIATGLNTRSGRARRVATAG